MNGASAHTTNGNSIPGSADSELSQLRNALDTAYDPQTSTELRQQATAFLEGAKRHPEAPTYGFELAIHFCYISASILGDPRCPLRAHRILNLAAHTIAEIPPRPVQCELSRYGLSDLRYQSYPHEL